MQCWKVDIGRSCKGISDQRTGIRYNRLAQRRNGEKEASMNKVILVGRLTRDPEIRYADKEKKRVFTRYTLAVERKIKKEQEPPADFIDDFDSKKKNVPESGTTVKRGRNVPDSGTQK